MVTRIKDAVFITDTEERSKSLYIEDGKIKGWSETSCREFIDKIMKETR